MSFSGASVPGAHGYSPISCFAYDVLEAAAVRRTPLRLSVDEGNGIEEVSALVLDLFARKGAEFARLRVSEQERIVRLDALRRIVDEATGKEYFPAACITPSQTR